MKNKLFLIILIVLSIFLVKNVKAESSDNVSGYAWSENIGWISFNCTNDLGSPCGTSNYGVDIDEGTGDFSGYAWSENIGWISFQPDDVEKGQCCLGGCRANFDSKTGLVSGFARALSASDGWDGCLKLRGKTGGGAGMPKDYGVSIDSLGNFSGWAWSDSVFGWVSFTHFNCDSDGDGQTDQNNYPNCPIKQSISDYQVKASLNGSPVASMKCDPGYWCAGEGCACDALNWVTFNQDADDNNAIYTIINESTDPDPGDSIAYSTWTLRNTATGEADSSKCPGLCNYTISGHEEAGDYTVELQVEDQKGDSSSLISHSLKIKQEASACFECSLNYSEDPDAWEPCSELENLTFGTVVYFKSDLPDPHCYSTPLERGFPIATNTWIFNGIEQSDRNPTSSYTLLPGSSNHIKLLIEGTDDSFDAEMDSSFPLFVPLPIWREVPAVSFKEKTFSFYRFFQV